jgi:hypothetical protein
MWAIAVAAAIVYIWAGFVFSAALLPEIYVPVDPGPDWKPFDVPVKPHGELPRTR